MCPKCSGIGRYYTEEYAGVKVHPCSCEQSKTMRQVQEVQFENFLRRLDESYEICFGKKRLSRTT